MLRIKEAIVVEGRYDKNTLSQVVDAVIVELGGFAVASEKGDPDGVEAASKALANRVKTEAMSIRDKYVNPPKTTDFAIMYLPTEGLYAEIIRREGLVEDIQNKFRIVVCGPTTIAALLNSLQMGFRSVAIEKRSTEIGKLLQGFMSDFALFTKYLKQTGDRLDTVKKSLENAEERTRIIGKKLNKVNSLSDDKGPDMSNLSHRRATKK